uniref:nucleoside 2-deoxyribosyltransferase n=1 Tax=Enterocloster clostridioformis TaxID=1531 RepID=UPI002674FF73|nr:nucleoside 2-deoxyribosyltransferase [Enterocloster clostridioformis]
MFEQEKIYIAGPECFYKGGPSILNAMRRRAESLGFGVTLPNEHPLDMGNPDLQKRADSIFEDLKNIMKETTVIIADLEAYRGSEADSGTIYEIGMAYADGLKCYGYTRDKRPLAWKDQKYTMQDGVVYDEKGKQAPYKELPFAPAVVGSTKIVEGDFDDCLSMLMTDLEEEWKAEGRKVSASRHEAEESGEMPKGRNMPGRGNIPGRPKIYLADLTRYENDADNIYKSLKNICRENGLEAVTPCDWAEELPKAESANPYTRAAALTENYRCLVKSCDAVLADLNNYRGYECANDVGFECGMGFEMGKKLFGYMDDTRPCIEKIPHLGETAEYRDMTGNNVENFNYPANLMFGSSMKIYKGKLEEVIKHVAKELLESCL